MTAEAPTNARERARAAVMARILEAGRQQLADHGAAGLSLRAVAREIGMVSSAVYRYVPSRDDLLTALLIESYDAVGAAVEVAAHGRGTPGRRFVRACTAVRQWGVAHPHQYALLYGSPVPGYRAPDATIGPATRTTRALAELAAEAHAAGNLHMDTTTRISKTLQKQCDAALAALHVELPHAAVLALIQGWTMAYGAISFELFGQFARTFDPADAALTHTFQQAARTVGFTDL